VTAGLSRRGFIAGAIAAGGALSLGFSFGCGGTQQLMIRRADQTGELTPNSFITVKPDGRIALAVHKAEMGQGVTTAYSTLAAEELDVPLDMIDFYFADALEEYRTTFGMQLTGGSGSTAEGFLPVRKAAAAAREMLVEAAAADWGVPASECTTDRGAVLHAKSSREIGYGKLTVKAAHLPVPQEPRLKKREDFRLIGKGSQRVDARSKVDGTALFGLDVSVPNMARAVAIHGPSFGSEPKRVESAAAKARPGVIGVYSFPWGVAVVAEKHWQALAASRDVEVEWTAGHVKGLDTEKVRAAAHAHTKEGEAQRDDGDVDQALRGATTTIEAIYDAPFLAHAPMETQNCTVHVKGDKVEVWAPSQAQTVLQSFVADAVGVSPSDVVVHTTYMGGGFGRRGVTDFAAQAAMVAKAVGRPVQLTWTRESDMTQGFYRPQSTAILKGAVDANGRAVAFSSHTLGQPISLDMAKAFKAIPGLPRGPMSVFVDSLIGMFATNTIADIFSLEGIKDTPYEIPNVRVAFTPVSTNVPVATWRSVGHSINAFVVESFIDELAHAAHKDPFEFRRGMLQNKPRERRTLEAVAALAKWGTPLPAGRARGIARHTSFFSDIAEVAEVEIVSGRIKVRRVYCVVDCGTAVNPDVVKAQVEGAVIYGLSAALDQEITLVDGVVQQKNFDTFPPLRMFESPEIIVQILESDKAPTGIGEPPLPPIAPAVANAVFALTKIRLRRMPLQRQLDEVLRDVKHPAAPPVPVAAPRSTKPGTKVGAR
jgi:CO/xanthine dehydrogenase Mo-binding subunit